MKRLVLSLVVIFGYVCTFVAVNVVHFLYFPVEVVLYDALLDCGIALLIWAPVCVFIVRHSQAVSPLEGTLSTAVGLLVAVNFALSVPTIIDRSLSIYILEKLAQRGGAIRHDAFPSIFVQEYMKEHRLVDIRLTEQLASGTILIENGCVELTPKGRFVASLTRYYRTHLLPKRRRIMGAYSDDLTDPFRHSTEANYACSPSGK